MSKVTVGHDSCSAWTSGDNQSPSSTDWSEPLVGGVTFGPPLWPLYTLVCPVIGIYAGAKAISKVVRASR